MNRQRKAKEWLRAYGSVERVNWIAGQRCVACGACSEGQGCENHHVRNGGRGRKADARFIVPMCWTCHRELHSLGRVQFEEYYGIDLDALAEQTDASWKAFCQEAAA